MRDEMDQAETLKRLMSDRRQVRPMRFRSVEVLSVTSGKGGVGKTNIVANLAITLQKQGRRVLVLDGDFGLANLNIVMGVEPKGTINDVIAGALDVEDIVVQGPHGVKLLPASSGIFKMSNLSLADKTILMERLEASNLGFDVLIMDTGAGINSDVLYLNAAANDVVVVATPEPTSIADAYALMKIMSQQHKLKKFKLIVNMVHDPREGLAVYNNLLDVADRFLNIGIEYLGSIAYDRRVSQSVVSRRVVCDLYPESPAAQSFEGIASNLIESARATPQLTGNVQFFWRTLMSEAKV